MKQAPTAIDVQLIIEKGGVVISHTATEIERSIEAAVEAATVRYEAIGYRIISHTVI